MKISNKTPGALGNVDSAKIGKANDSAKKADAGLLDSIADSAKVDLSSRAMDIRKAKELATPTNDIDEAKVARLQKLIDAGEYRVDADAVADRLVDQHLLLPN